LSDAASGRKQKGCGIAAAWVPWIQSYMEALNLAPAPLRLLLPADLKFLLPADLKFLLPADLKFFTALFMLMPLGLRVAGVDAGVAEWLAVTAFLVALRLVIKDFFWIAMVLSLLEF
jgi:hypothetical protein